jgi:hypothetical protein
MKKKNKVDDRLEKRSTKKTSYPKSSAWDMYQSLYRDPIMTKILLLQLEKQYKKVFKSWGDFWDMCLDTNPQYCFLCGYYILPKMRNDKDRIKRPYKNGDVVHAYCFQKESTVERMTGKLNDKAELICHADKGWSMTGKVCRVRIKNDVEVLRHHLGEFHSAEFTHEGNLEFLRAIYTLKPNGRKFRSPIL